MPNPIPESPETPAQILTTGWARQRSLFEQAIALAPAAQSELITDLASQEPELAQSLHAMLAAHAKFAGHTQAQSNEVLEQAQSALVDSTQPLAGIQIGNYQLERELGRGGMSVVWQAKRSDGQVTQRVAIKLLAAHRFEASSRARFESERNLLAALEHPGIARLLDAGSFQGQPYYVMEYVEGLSITEYVNANQLNTQARLALFEQVCNAVSFAHRNLIVHRDLKPSNVLVDSEGRVKLIDFGIAKPLSDVAATGTAQRFFSPVYAAPEQLSGQISGVSVDVYQLGALLYELLSGKPPFDFSASSPAQIEQAIRFEVPKAWKNKPGPMQRDLAAIALHALRKEAHQRYATVDDLFDDIRRTQQHQPIQIARSNWRYRGGKFIRRNWLGLGVVALIGAVLLGSLISFQRQNVLVNLERDRAQSSAERAQSTAAFFTRLFDNSNPYVELRPDMTLIEVLKKAAEALQVDKAIDPVAKIDVGLTVAGSLKSLGESAQAKQFLLALDELCAKSCLPLHQIQLATAKASYLADEGEMEKASELLAYSQRRLPEIETDEPVAVSALAQLLTVRLAVERGGKSFSNANSVETIAQWKKYSNRFDVDTPEMLALDAIYARTLASMKDHKQATKLLEALLIRRQSVPHDQAFALMTIYLALGQVADSSGLPEKACIHLQSAKKYAVEHLGKDAEWIAKINLNLSSCQKRLGQVDAAILNLKDALRIVSRNTESTLAKGAVNYNLALVYFESGQFDAALPHVREARQHYQTAFGASHPISMVYTIREAALQLKLGNSREAGVLFDQVRSLPALQAESTADLRVALAIYECLVLAKANKALPPELKSLLEKVDETTVDSFAKDALIQLVDLKAIKK